MILIIGGSGNMGKRYRAILTELQVDWDIYDTKIDKGPRHAKARSADGFIICTPTHTHVDTIISLMSYGKPILCEKPISKEIFEVLDVVKMARRNYANLQMVNQYAFMPIGEGGGETVYDYYRHGEDGIFWDCINIIGLAKGAATIREHSPKWTCKINGEDLNLSQIDSAYIRMIDSWLRKPVPNLEYIESAHQKVMGIDGR